eukprot:TRINITY_DN4676_c0_g2_i1.p1 TRINITY_DN4676_c0_g2~~TRINITY_DN4676_c0_g2_i1.p1  ORF type:complete len:372 (+),score=51.34 TRINITY_DN4676_c0_g2_i1:311-1426(+)
MMKAGYEKLYIRRTRDKKDGVAIFFLSTRFTKLRHCWLELFVADDHPFLDRDNVSVFAVLQDKENPWAAFVVANCHLIFNMRRGDVKLAQMVVIERTIKAIVDALEADEATKGLKAHVLWAGDFNLVPSSALYAYLRYGTFDFLQSNFKCFSGQEKMAYGLLRRRPTLTDALRSIAGSFDPRYEQPAWYESSLNYNRLGYFLAGLQLKLPQRDGKVLIDGQIKLPFIPPATEWWPLSLTTSLTYRSAYASFQKTWYGRYPKSEFRPWSTYEPFATCISKSGIGTVDYLWFATKDTKGEEKFRAKAIYETPTVDTIEAYSKQVPNTVIPSDHLPLIVDFEYSLSSLSLIHISEPTRQAEISYAVFCLKKKNI